MNIIQLSLSGGSTQLIATVARESDPAYEDFSEKPPSPGPPQHTSITPNPSCLIGIGFGTYYTIIYYNYNTEAPERFRSYLSPSIRDLPQHSCITPNVEDPR